MLQDFPKNWLSFLKNHDLKKQLLSIEARLEEEIKLGKIIFPKREIIFRSLQLVQPDEVKVVILGQDPYHNFNQADGLAFSVSNFQSLPPSLINIFIAVWLVNARLYPMTVSLMRLLMHENQPRWKYYL